MNRHCKLISKTPASAQTLLTLKLNAITQVFSDVVRMYTNKGIFS